MHSADWIVLTTYLVGTVLLGVLLGKWVKNSSDLFAAGGQSPWWASGLSAFMTMFSANTFVVWGGMAYQYGIVAIMLNLCYGIAALLAGYTVAGRWKRLGIRTPAEYVERRFGRRALHFFTWAFMAFRMVGAAGALYAIAKLTVAVTSGSDNTSAVVGLPPTLITAILVFGAIIIVYTMIGGLWAVLMTDVIQFIVLNVAVVFVVALILTDMGGFSTFVSMAPEGFFSLTSGPKYTWFFLFGWVAVHYFMIGAEFAFVQRYICVPSPRDAIKGTVLFGLLYLLSPFLWLLPPLLWRVQSPIPEGASPDLVTSIKEEAYIRSCKSVLPIGMIGLMMAAMFSATASLISSQLNVFSGVLTNDIYKPLAKAVSESKLLLAGRTFTVILGVIMVVIALLIPMLGGAERVIVSITELMAVPLLAPILWSLFSKRIQSSALWLTAGLCIPLGILFHFGFTAPDSSGKGHGFLYSLRERGDFYLWLSYHSKTLVGVILPMIIMIIVQCSARRDSRRWQAVEDLITERVAACDKTRANTLPAKIVGWCIIALGTGMLSLIPINSSHRLAIGLFTGALMAIGALILMGAKWMHSKQQSP